MTTASLAWAQAPVCEVTGATVNKCSSTAVTVTPVTNQFQFRNDNTGGSPKAFMRLTCKAFPNFLTTAFKGSQTVNPGGSGFVACGVGKGNVFTIECGSNNTCSGGVN